MDLDPKAAQRFGVTRTAIYGRIERRTLVTRPKGIQPRFAFGRLQISRSTKPSTIELFLNRHGKGPYSKERGAVATTWPTS